MNARQGRHPICFTRLRHSALDVDAFLLWAGVKNMTSSNVMMAARDIRDNSNNHFLASMKLAIAIIATTSYGNAIRKDRMDGDSVEYKGRHYVNNVLTDNPDQLVIHAPHKDGGYVQVGVVNLSEHVHCLGWDWELQFPSGVRELTAFLLNRKKLTKGFHRRFNRAVLAYWLELTDN